MYYNAAMKKLLPAGLAVLILALAAGTAAAQPFGQRGPAQERVLSERGISLDEAVARAERRHAARVVRAEERRNGDRVVYRIRLLGADGRVFEVTVDAATGAEL